MDFKLAVFKTAMCLVLVGQWTLSQHNIKIVTVCLVLDGTWTSSWPYLKLLHAKC